MLQLRINGRTRQLDSDIDPTTPLLWVLRDHLGLDGTKYGCGIGACGACTVHRNGKPIRSCQTPVSQVAEAEITSIEGLTDHDSFARLKQAWIDMDVPQCGYCQPGQLMSAAALLAHNSNPTEEDIDKAMSANLCRCGTYNRIKAAIFAAATHFAVEERKLSHAGG